ncbi:MAG: hypothetical protein N4A57_14945 [Anaeromicrobium sp.]|jgi:hypothetical protein|uniref:hypothetical protein n=1 Tax=Anaeromicrobium sp. TaxID=1929132 RepID=UPI0026002E06|nr:hypothetical protein [Anaeromicrobium sp.]MCT4595544.1 hypothetical protein [Anaeromicrobium sp.]
MDNWVDTPYGKRYKEDYNKTMAFFMTAPQEKGKRNIPDDLMDIILEEYIHIKRHLVNNKED